MKAAVLTVMLLATYVKSQDILPAEPVLTDLVLPIKCDDCVFLTRSVLVTKGACSGYVTVGYCSGCCRSSVSYSPYSLLKVTRSCSCCTETEMAAKAVILKCPLNKSIVYRYYTIVACDCVCAKCSVPPFDMSALPSLETAEVSEADEVSA
uniref:Sperm motility initiating substance n=1 Tax=Cynops pyrrhogaster TaxID=8330 RepID=A0A1B4ZBJ5_CYNPY|nr:sperm motility initiating substance [Cynops pyrrhogaster]